MKLTGIFLPIVTPFVDGRVDYDAYEKLVRYYLKKGISGLIPLGTTGEGPTISMAEYEEILERTAEMVNGLIPVYVGAGGNNTQKVLEILKRLERYPVEGILSVCPYYNRPSQQGIFEHFQRISESTDRKIIIYNIPYRTGVNLSNPYLFRLAEMKNIVAVKDSCGDFSQTLALIADKPHDFSVLTGEDLMFFAATASGGDGGILASSHLHTEKFVKIFRLLSENNHQAALEIWRPLSTMIPLLFREPNPAPLKHCLKKLGLIPADDLRLPLTPVSGELAGKLDEWLAGIRMMNSRD